MSKKLLEEQSIRKFMKIAGLQPLANSFLKENETVEEGYGKDKKMEEQAQDKKGEDKKLEEVEDLEEGKKELDEERSGFVSEREDDERATSADRVHEAKALVGKVKTKGGAKMSPAKKSTKNGSSGKGLVKEEDMPEEGSEDVEAPEMDAAPEGDMGAGGLDVEGLVKELIRVITEKVPGAADVISVEEESDELEVETGSDMGEKEVEMDDMEGEEDALDEAALEQVVAETVKRVKARLMESKKATKTTVSKQELAKKVAAKVAEKLKKV
jgi:hypothetical protein